MSVDAVSFRRVLGQFASGVTIVSTRDGEGRPLGLTVSAFCSVSLHPPLILACLGRRSEVNAGIRTSGHFGVSILAEDQEAVSRRFATSGRTRFDEPPPLVGRHGLPLVPGALGHLECRVRSFHDEGDHTVWVGEVVALSARPGRPLLYHHGDYRRLEGAARGGTAGPDRV
jgi:flavin reductase (DIM6/NTAB) family NADH-FMN oxidoreductase RutF